MDRPKPVPLPTPLVEKKGSTALASVSASIPSPVSLTESTANRPAGTPSCSSPTTCLGSQLDRQDAARKHRVPRINGEIEQSHFELVRVDSNGGQFALRPRSQREPRAHRAIDEVPSYPPQGFAGLWLAPSVPACGQRRAAVASKWRRGGRPPLRHPQACEVAHPLLIFWKAGPDCR